MPRSSDNINLHESDDGSVKSKQKSVSFISSKVLFNSLQKKNNPNLLQSKFMLGKIGQGTLLFLIRVMMRYQMVREMRMEMRMKTGKVVPLASQLQYLE